MYLSHSLIALSCLRRDRNRDFITDGHYLTLDCKLCPQLMNVNDMGLLSQDQVKSILIYASFSHYLLIIGHLNFTETKIQHLIALQKTPRKSQYCDSWPKYCLRGFESYPVHCSMAMCIELATQKGWRRYAFPRFISFLLRYLSQTERYSHVLWLIWKLI